MEKKGKTPILEGIIKGLEEIQEVEIRSRKRAKILFRLILVATFYLLGLFIYWVKIASSMDSNDFIHVYKLPLISLAVAVCICIIQNIRRYIRKKRLQRFPVSEIRIMIEMKKVPDLLISPLGENTDAKCIREYLFGIKTYDKTTFSILVFILRLIKSKDGLEALRNTLEALRNTLEALRKSLEALRNTLEALRNTLEALRNTLEALRNTLVSEIEKLDVAKRNQYLQELSAFEEFFANLS